MHFETVIFCKKCREWRLFSLTLLQDAEIFKRVSFICHTCGNHGTDWISKENYLDLFNDRVKKTINCGVKK